MDAVVGVEEEALADGGEAPDVAAGLAAPDVPDKPRPPRSAVASPELITMILVGALEVERLAGSGELVGEGAAPQQLRSVRGAIRARQPARPEEKEGAAYVGELGKASDLEAAVAALRGGADGSTRSAPRSRTSTTSTVKSAPLIKESNKRRIPSWPMEEGA